MFKLVNRGFDQLVFWPAENEGKFFMAGIAGRTTSGHSGGRPCERSFEQLEPNCLAGRQMNLELRIYLASQRRIIEVTKGSKSPGYASGCADSGHGHQPQSHGGAGAFEDKSSGACSRRKSF